MTKYRASKVIMISDGTIFKVAELKKYNIVLKEKGIQFDSIAESEYYRILKNKLDNGLIKDLELQPKFLLQEKFVKNKVTHRKIEYIADFKVTHNSGKVEIIDVKGMQTAAFRMKKKMFEMKHPELELTLVCKKGRVWGHSK